MHQIALALMNSLSTWSLDSKSGDAGLLPFGLSDTQALNDFRASDDTWLTQLFCARMCHDLVGPAGAVNAGVEFVTTSGVDTEALALIGTSARQVTGRLAYLRFIFGTNASTGRALTVAEAKSLAELPVVAGRASLDWRIAVNGDAGRPMFDRDSMRILLGVIQVCSDALRRGGTIRMTSTSRPLARQVKIEADGGGLTLDDEIVLALQGSIAVGDLTPRLVYAHIISRLPAALGIETAIHRRADDLLEVTVDCPKRCPAVT